MPHPILRAARVTKYLPSFKGLSKILSVYQKVATKELLPIDDFDDDLKMKVSVRETIGINLWHNPKQFERAERAKFCATLTPGCTVLDIGANIGIYTLLAAKRKARVFSIEADPKNAAMLKHHIEINSFADRVKVFEMAATDREQELPLFRHPGNFGGSNIFEGTERAGTIQGRTIDSLNLPPIDVCKIDIEGSEIFALRGMRKTIANSPNMQMLIEVCDDHQDSRELRKFLRENFSQLQVIGTIRPGYYNMWVKR